MSEDGTLPSGWAALKLGELFASERRGIEPAQYPEQEFELWSVPAFPSGTPEIVRGRQVGSNKQRVSPGDVLLCKINPRINRVWVVGAARGLPQIASTEWIVLRSEGFEPHFLAHQLREGGFRERLCAEVSGVGGSLTRARPQTVAELELVRAPLPEQRRIVAKLDDMLAGSRAARAALDAVPTLLAQYRQSVLCAAFSGELTSDWRAKHPTLVSERRVVPFETLAASLRGGTATTSLKTPTRWPVLKSSAVRPGQIDLSDCSYLPEGEPPSADHLLSDGDVLITRLSGSLEYVGNAAIVQGLGERRIAYPDRLFRARLKPDLDPVYVTAAFRDQRLRTSLEEAAKSSAGHQRISLSDVRRFPIPLVALAEQREVARQIALQLASVEELRAKIAVIQSQLDKLDQRALAKAFRGQLVPQHSADEPATALLPRVRVERIAPTRTARRRTPPSL